MRILFQIILLLCVCTSATAEVLSQDGSLKGRIIDETDSSAVIGASIYFPELKIGTTTDEKGYYFISGLPDRKMIVQVSYLGHQTITRTIDISSTTSSDFVLKESNAMINEVVVTAPTGSTIQSKSPYSTSIISNNQIHELSSTNIIDAISHQPGVSQVTTGSGISKPVIRGLGYNRVLVINDGVRQEGQQWGDEHGIEVDAQSIGSVEVIKGPASLMYGSDAMAGVLIFHDAPILSEGKMQANVSTEYQTNQGLFDYSLDFAGNKKGFVWNWRYSDKMAHAYKNKYDGYVYGSNFKERAVSGLLGLHRSWGYSHLKLSYYYITPGIVEGERDEETGKFVRPAIVDGEEGEIIASDSDMKSYSHTLPYQKVRHYKAVLDNSFVVGSGNIKALIGYQQNRRQEFEEVMSPDECGLDFLLHTVNYDVHYTLADIDGWRFSGGANGMYQHSINKGTEFLIPEYNLFDYGIFATFTKELGRFNISGGIRYDHRHLKSHSLTDDGEERFEAFSRNFDALTGSIGATYKVSDNFNLKLNISRGFRAPNISELASNGVHEGTVRYELGNKNLDAEKSLQLDFGADYSSRMFSVQLALFANRISDYIFSSKLADANGNEIILDGCPVYQFTSGDANIYGGEVSVDFHPIERLHFENAFSYVYSILRNQPNESKYLPLTPAPKWTSDLKYDIIRDGKTFDNLFAKISLECYLLQSHYYVLNGTETATPSYTLVNLSAGTDFKVKGHKIVSVYIMANNIFDRAYQSHLSRLKYTAVNNATGRTGVYNMGRNFGIKVLVPINF